MPGSNPRRAAAAGLGSVVAMGLAGAAPAARDDPVVTLAASGRAGVRVEGTCVLRGLAGETTREAISAAVPFERRWRGRALRCELRVDGPATVELTGAGSRSRTSTSGGRLVVEVR